MVSVRAIDDFMLVLAKRLSIEPFSSIVLGVIVIASSVLVLREVIF